MAIEGRITGAAVALGCLAVLAGGCQTFKDVGNGLGSNARVAPFVGRSNGTSSGGYSVPASSTISAEELARNHPNAVDLDTLKLPGSDQFAVNDAMQNAGRRNELLDYMLTRSDEICIIHKSNIVAVASSVNAGFSAITTVVGGVGSIVTGASAARALAGTAAIANGLREDVNENVYYNNFATAIVRKIDDMRTAKLQEIAPKRVKAPTDYGVDGVVRDVVEYHNLCSFSEAVAALATDTKRPSSSNEIVGKLASLRSEYDNNAKVLADKDTPPATAKTLTDTNASIAQMIQMLTLQLGFANGFVQSGATTDETTPPPPK